MKPPRISDVSVTPDRADCVDELEYALRAITHAARFAGPNQIWVCPGCGRTSREDGDRYNMGDTSCVMWAILCHKDKVNGKWVAVAESESHAGPSLNDETPSATG